MTIDDIKQFLKRVKKDKKISIYIIVTLIAVILLFYLNIIDSSKENKSKSSNITSETLNSEQDYIKQIEYELTEIISEIDGAGNTKVMATSYGTEKCEFAKDEHNIQSGDRNETDKKTIYDNNDSPVKVSISNPDIKGVVVICEGGDVSIVKEKIYKAVSTALDINTNQIYVTKKTEKEIFK